MKQRKSFPDYFKIEHTFKTYVRNFYTSRPLLLDLTFTVYQRREHSLR